MESTQHEFTTGPRAVNGPMPESSGAFATEGQPRRKRLALVLILAAPALFTGWLIFLYGVDVPYMDHWDFVCWALENANAGTLGLTHFTEPFGPHRVFFPRLILFVLAKLTHWNIRAELLLTWLATCACAWNLWRLAAITGMNPRRDGRWLLFAAFLLLFSPMQLEVWFSGVEAQYVLTTVCLTACLWILPTVRFPMNVLLTMALCVVGTFTIASGLTFWILLLPLLWLHSSHLSGRGRIGWGLLWLFAFATCLFLYFHGNVYVSPGADLAGFGRQPFQAIQYSLIFLGGAFGRGTSIDPLILTQITGGVLVLAAAVVGGYLCRWRGDSGLQTRAWPWLVLASFGLANAAMTAVGRLGLGLTQALSPRYVAGSVMLPIGLLFLVPLLFRHWRAGTTDVRHAAKVKIGLFVLAGVLGLLHLAGLLQCLPAWKQVQHVRLASKALLLLSHAVDEDETLLRATAMNQPGRTNEPALTKGHVKLLDRIGYLRPPLLRTNAIRGIIGAAPSDARDFGEIQNVVRPDAQRLALAGWAVLPDKRRVADAVLLTYEDPEREPILFAVALVEWSGPDLISLVRRLGYFRQSGWNKTIDTSVLPAGERLIRAWAFDAETARAYPLRGKVTVLGGQAKTPRTEK